MLSHEFELDQEEKDILDAFEAGDFESGLTPERNAYIAQLAEESDKQRTREGTNLVLLDSDVADAFPTAEAVNEALRLVLRLSAIPAGDDKRPTAT